MKKTGIIKRMFYNKSFGFIDTGKEEIFFHASKVPNNRFIELEVKDKVEFIEIQNIKGKSAAEVIINN